MTAIQVTTSYRDRCDGFPIATDCTSIVAVDFLKEHFPEDSQSTSRPDGVLDTLYKAASELCGLERGDESLLRDKLVGEAVTMSCIQSSSRT